jgi:hypothetical protein
MKSIALASLIGLANCASAAPGVTLAAVGPKPAGVHASGPMEGYLKVYSATREFNDGDLMYYPHSRYSIYLTNGTRYKWVDNHETDSDESPERVALPTGTYYVLAQSDQDGLVKVAVVIKGGQTTVVNLENGRTSDSDTQGVQTSRAVKLPSGQIIGWRASS